MRRLRILQIFNRYLHFGGEESSVFRIGDALQADHEVEYFFGSTQDFFGPGGIRRLTAPVRSFHDSAVAANLRRYQEVGQFDLWQVHNIFPGLSPSVYQTAFALQVPIVHFLHNYRFGCVNGSWINHGRLCQRCLGGNLWPAFTTACWHDSRWVSGWQALILLYLRHLNVRQRVARWIALSEAQKNLHLAMGFPGNRISVIPHFYEVQSAPPPSAPAGAILFLSRLSPEKGGAELLQAWQRWPSPDRELWIAGSGPEEARLRKMAAPLPRVQFLGFLDAEAKDRAWTGSAMAVIPSLVPETFGLIVLEAWARQRPVIAYRIGALAETIDDGVNGLLVNPGDSAGLAQAMESLSRNPARVVEMGRAGHQKLLSLFNRRSWLSQMEHLYDVTLPKK